MTDISLAKTLQDEKLTLSGYGFTMKISSNSEPVLFDATGKEIVDAQHRMNAQKALVLPLIQTLGASWQQEMATSHQVLAAITDMSASLKTSLTFPVNNNEPEIGQVMLDGTVYAGISISTETKMFAMPKDTGIMTWNDADEFIKTMSQQHGYKGSRQRTAVALETPKKDDGSWRLPTSDELNQLFENRDDIGGFDTTGLWYWSLSPHSYSLARVQEFYDGERDIFSRGRALAFRCVRTEPRQQP